MSIKQKIIIFLSILFISVLGNAFLTYKLEQYSQEKAQWIKHTNEVIFSMNEYLMSMQDAETGQRGYLLTQKSTYLEPYHTGMKNAQEYYTELMERTLDKKNKKLLEEMKVLETQKFSELKTTIELINSQKIEKALEKLVDIQKKSPTWESELINYRIIIVEKYSGA